MPLDPSQQISLNTGNGVFSVWDEGYKELLSNNNTLTKASRIIVCTGAIRAALGVALLGGSTAVAGTTLVVRGMPHPTYAGLYCSNVGAEQVGKLMDNGGVALSDYARLTIDYTVPQFNFGDTGNLGSQELDFSSTAIAFDPYGSYFQWTSDGAPLPLGQLPNLRLTTCTLTQTRYNSAVLPVNAILQSLDNVNSNTFLGADPGQVLFRGARASRNITMSGTQNWNITYVFELNRVGWNKLLRASTSGYEAFTLLNGDPVYPSSDISGLLN